MDREKLSQIIETHESDWWKPCPFEANVKFLLPKELEIISPPPAHKQNYNCFVFVFGLQNDLDFLGGNNPIQQEFIKYLINKSILIPVDGHNAENFVFYKNKIGDITHAGIMESNDFVISKWMWGPTIRHRFFDVPSSFGNTVLFFKPISTSTAKETYNAYKASGVDIKAIG